MAYLKCSLVLCLWRRQRCTDGRVVKPVPGKCEMVVAAQIVMVVVVVVEH
jgi:hypothetical protein